MVLNTKVKVAELIQNSETLLKVLQQRRTCLETCLRKINLFIIRRVGFKDINLETGKLVKR